MSAEVWDQLYQRLANLVGEHRTTLIFVNTRRLVERVTRHLSDLLGEENVAAHHGSLADSVSMPSDRSSMASFKACHRLPRTRH